MTADGEIASVARDYGAGVIIMHMQGQPRTMQDNPVYDDVVADVSAYLKKRVEELRGYGLEEETMAVDPGIGFGKTFEHNLLLLNGIHDLKKINRPVAVGLSRKSFIGRITGAGVDSRLGGSIAGMLYAVEGGASIVRVHDVMESRQALDLYEALRKTGS